MYIDLFVKQHIQAQIASDAALNHLIGIQMPVTPYQPDDIIQFWFDRPLSEAGTASYRKVWFAKNADFDAVVKQRFADVYAAGLAGQLDPWRTTPTGTLALILLFDQFPRNMFRDTPAAFATDAKALELAKGAIAQGFDQQLTPMQRWFVYMPFMHSESLNDQQRSVELFETLRTHPAIASAYDYALKHRAVIERFGRFPHRNVLLDRTSTPTELEFLTQPGSSF